MPSHAELLRILGKLPPVQLRCEVHIWRGETCAVCKTPAVRHG